MVRFGYVQTPDYPLSDSIDMIKTADDLGFYACYSVDEIYHKDMWLLFAAAADKTRNIRMGPNVTHVILRDPTLIAQQLATLDELTGGRAEAVVSFGSLVMLSQYHVEWKGSRPLAPGPGGLRGHADPARHRQDRPRGRVLQLLGPVHRRPAGPGARCRADGGDGRTAQLRTGRGDRRRHAPRPRLLQGELRVRGRARPQGAEKAGRDVADLDLGAWVISVVANDAKVAKEAARIIVAFYIPSMPQSQVERHGIEYASLQPIFDAFASGDVPKAIELTPGWSTSCRSPAPPRSASTSSRPTSCPGINHVIAALVDPVLVKFFSARPWTCPT